ncbi:FUSC family protein [Paraburkholderia hospita]|uniref:FUSC family protein n=1 Tax=Paraburkholderia hospita TaxID=169430 RepID=UPI000B345639|nr:FUSC family protein [Paraburkholderia hospita]OUL77796.1 fusaric acid resistance protein [Paraburkholderia hospita]
MRSKWVPSPRLLMFAGRIAFAAMLGLLCSILLGLHEPHWAAWTVVSVGLPARGDGLLKSLNRAVGTAVGAPVGVLLVVAAHDSEPLLVGLLAIWLAVCVYAGLSRRNYRAYATVLAGYSAVIVAMSLTGETTQLFELGRDRCIGIFIGLACALLVLLLSRDVQIGAANRHIRRAIAVAFAWSADRLAGLPRAQAVDGNGPQRMRHQFKDILALDSAVHSAVAESPALWARARGFRGIVSVLLDVLVVSRSIERHFEEGAARNGSVINEIDTALVEASALLTAIARTLRDDPNDEIETLSAFRLQAQALRNRLVDIRTGNVIDRRRVDLVVALLGAAEAALNIYAALAGERSDGGTEDYPTPVYAFDGRYAIVGALRAGAALLLAGAIWINTGWHGGTLFVSFTAIAIALFAIRPDPRQTGVHFLASGTVGAAAAFLFYMTIAPHVPHAMGAALIEVSIVFLAIVISSLLSNTFWASGFCLVFLVVSDPEFIVHTMTTVVSDHALGVLAGSALAALAFHVVPSRGLEHRWRRRHIKRIAGSTRMLIASPVAQQTSHTHHAWQSRSIDSLVRLALPAASTNEVDESMAWIEIGVELLKLQDASRTGVEWLTSGTKKTLAELLMDLRTLDPRSWHARFIAAEHALRREETSGNQMELRARANLLEISSLLKHAVVTQDRTNATENRGKQQSFS